MNERNLFPENAAGANADAGIPEQDQTGFSPRDDDILQELEEEDFFDEDSERLQELLDKVKASGGMNFVQMDGFLHGVICHAGSIPPSVFIPEILGENVRDMLTDNELRETAKLILNHYTQLQDMVEGKIFYAMPVIRPLDDEWEDDPDDIDAEDAEDEEVFAENQKDDAETYAAALPDAEPDAEIEELYQEIQRLHEEIAVEESAWARAFLEALYMGGGMERLLSTDQEDETIPLIPLLMLAHNELPVEENSPVSGQPLTPEARESALRLLSICVMEIYQILHSPLKKRKKASRNDPCPCGSGKKYKKCCLNKIVS